MIMATTGGHIENIPSPDSHSYNRNVEDNEDINPLHPIHITGFRMFLEHKKNNVYYRTVDHVDCSGDFSETSNVYIKACTTDRPFVDYNNALKLEISSNCNSVQSNLSKLTSERRSSKLIIDKNPQIAYEIQYPTDYESENSQNVFNQCILPESAHREQDFTGVQTPNISIWVPKDTTKSIVDSSTNTDRPNMKSVSIQSASSTKPTETGKKQERRALPEDQDPSLLIDRIHGLARTKEPVHVAAITDQDESKISIHNEGCPSTNAFPNNLLEPNFRRRNAKERRQNPFVSYLTKQESSEFINSKIVKGNRAMTDQSTFIESNMATNCISQATINVVSKPDDEDKTNKNKKLRAEVGNLFAVYKKEGNLERMSSSSSLSCKFLNTTIQETQKTPQDIRWTFPSHAPDNDISKEELVRMNNIANHISAHNKLKFEENFHGLTSSHLEPQNKGGHSPEDIQNEFSEYISDTFLTEADKRLRIHLPFKQLSIATGLISSPPKQQSTIDPIYNALVTKIPCAKVLHETCSATEDLEEMRSFSEKQLESGSKESNVIKQAVSNCTPYKIPQNVGSQSPENVRNATTEYISDILPTMVDGCFKIPLTLQRAAFATDFISGLSNQPVTNPIITNMPCSKSQHEICTENDNKEEARSADKQLDRGSAIAGNQVPSIEHSSKASKSIIFYRSSQSLKHRNDKTMISLCDNCYFKTLEMVDKQTEGVLLRKIPGAKDAVVPHGMEFPCTDTSQQLECKEISEPGEEELNYSASEKLETEDLNIFCEAVNSHLLNLKPVEDGRLKNAVTILTQKWFHVICDKNSKRKEIHNYLKYFEGFSNNLVKMLLYSTDNKGNNALHFAFGNNRFDIAEELLSYNCGSDLLTRKNKLGHSPLMVCAVSQPKKAQDWNVVQKAIDLGKVNEASKFSGQTLLMNSASRGCVKMVRLLLEAGADPNRQDNDGSTALMYASVHGHKTCVTVLFEHPKCDPRIKDYDNQTACSIALNAGYKDIALLIYLNSKRKRKLNKTKQIAKHRQKQTDLLKTKNCEVLDHTISKSQLDNIQSIKISKSI